MLLCSTAKFRSQKKQAAPVGRHLTLLRFGLSYSITELPYNSRPDDHGLPITLERE